MTQIYFFMRSPVENLFSLLNTKAFRASIGHSKMKCVYETLRIRKSQKRNLLLNKLLLINAS